MLDLIKINNDPQPLAGANKNITKNQIACGGGIVISPVNESYERAIHPV